MDNKKKGSDNLSSPLSKVKGLGSAKYGVEDWWAQRLLALVMVPLTLWFVASTLGHAVYGSPESLRSWLAQPIPAIMMFLLLGTVFLHAKLGLQVIIEDYVGNPIAKTIMLVANNFVCFLCAVVSIFAVLKLHFIDSGVFSSSLL